MVAAAALVAAAAAAALVAAAAVVAAVVGRGRSDPDRGGKARTGPRPGRGGIWLGFGLGLGAPYTCERRLRRVDSSPLARPSYANPTLALTLILILILTLTSYAATLLPSAPARESLP